MKTSFERALVVVGTVCLLLGWTGSTAGAVPGYPTEGQWSVGPTLTLEHWRSGAESILAYGEGSGIVIADVSDPASILVLGWVDTGAVVEYIAISDDGQTAAVSDRQRWVTLVDISNRLAPTVLAHLEVDGGGSPYGLTFGVDTLYVAVRKIGLWVVDISDPSMPVLVGEFLEIGTDFVFDVEVFGSYAFLADDEQGVSAIDVSDPTLPVLADRYLGADLASHITIDGTTAYISRRGDGLTILDLSSAPAMVEIGTVVPGGILYRTEIAAPGVAVCADGNLGMHVVDVSVPATPSVEATYPVSVGGVATDGETAFAFRHYDFEPPTLYALTVDTSAPFDLPTESGTLPLAGENVDVTVVGNTVVVANERGGAFVTDATDPVQPVTVSRIDVSGRRVDALERVGATLVYASFGGDLGLVDLSDPQNPNPLPNFAVPGSGDSRDVTKLPGVAGVAVAADDAGVRIVDLSDPSAPFEVGFWEPVSGVVRFVDVDGSRIAAAGAFDVWILDASTLSTPVTESSFSVTDPVLDVAIDGDIAYLATGSDGVRIWDVSDPLNPDEVAVFDTAPTSAFGVEVLGDRLYVAASEYWGLFVVDITDPSNPIQLDVADTPGKALKVVATESLVVAADGVGGVRIWSTQEPGALFVNGFEAGSTLAWDETVQ